MEPRSNSQQPTGSLLACYMVTAIVAVTTFMPGFWFISTPLAAASLVGSIFLRNQRKHRVGLLACFFISALALLVGLGGVATYRGGAR